MVDTLLEQQSWISFKIKIYLVNIGPSWKKNINDLDSDKTTTKNFNFYARKHTTLIMNNTKQAYANNSVMTIYKLEHFHLKLIEHKWRKHDTAYILYFTEWHVHWRNIKHLQAGVWWYKFNNLKRASNFSTNIGGTKNDFGIELISFDV